MEFRKQSPNPIRTGHARYCGNVKSLKGKGALIAEYMDHVEVQFDTGPHGLTHGWHPFSKEEFIWERIDGSEFRK